MTWATARHIHPLDFDILKDTEQWDFNEAWRLIDNVSASSAFRGVATFLLTLRMNIQLSSDSAPLSPAVFPRRQPILPRPSPSPPSIMTSYQNQETTPAADPLPQLKTYSPSTNAEKLSALRLVADSVAQQRQQAARKLLANTYVVATLALVLALEAYWLNAIALLTTGTGTIMAVLLAIRWLTNPYLEAAERINWDWLTDATTTVSTSASGHNRTYSNGHKRTRSASIEDPVLMVTKWGEEIIGAVVIRLSKRDKKGFVRAWTVANRYRGKGVGKDLLQQGVKVAMGKSGVKGVVFEDDHAHSAVQLSPFIDASFEARDERAEETLAKVVASTKGHRRTNS